MEIAITLLSPRDAAKRLNLSTSRVQQLDRQGLLPAIRDSSGRRLYDPEQVERYAREREQRQELSRRGPDMDQALLGGPSLPVDGTPSPRLGRHGTNHEPPPEHGVDGSLVAARKAHGGPV